MSSMTSIDGLKGVFDFLSNAPVMFLVTENGEQPRARPVTFIMEDSGSIFFGVGTHKDVYQQMQDNPRVEIIAEKDNEFLRYDGTAVFTDDPRLQVKARETLPLLADLYNEKTGLILALFSLSDAEAELGNILGEKKTISF